MTTATTPATAMPETAEAAAVQTERPRLEHSAMMLLSGELLLPDMNEAERAYVLEVAQSGGYGSQDAIRVIYRSMVAEPENGARFLDLPRRVRRALIAATYREQNELACRTAMMKADMLEASLLGEASASPLERLLIERVVTCWLAAELADMDAASQDSETGTPMLSANIPGRVTIAGHFAKRQERAHRRFLQSVDALMRMRRLMSPLPLMAGQVNIAGPGAQQLNVSAVSENERK